MQTLYVAGSGARLSWCKSFTSWRNSWTWHEWRFSHHHFTRPSAKASWPSSCIDECNNKCWTIFQILWRCPNYAYSGTVTFRKQYPLKWFLCIILTSRCFEQGFTFPVAELFLEDILEKTQYKIKSERDNFQGSSRKKRLASVKNDPLADVFEVNLSYFSNLAHCSFVIQCWCQGIISSEMANI